MLAIPGAISPATAAIIAPLFSRIDDAVPNELYPGIDYVAHAFDPDGHCIQLYYYMEQVGWDGQPRPSALRPTVTPGVWPDVVRRSPTATVVSHSLAPGGELWPLLIFVTS
jgi:hypothetical protein